MNLSFTGRNLYIVNKKPQIMREIEVMNSTIRLKNDDGILEAGEIDLCQDLYACLYSSQLKNITFIINKDEAVNASLIMSDALQFEKVLKIMKEACPDLHLSEQNAKINSYAASVVEKLREGVEVTIMDTKEEKGIKYCPDCGMQCDPNIPYCMECGASV